MASSKLLHIPAFGSLLLAAACGGRAEPIDERGSSPGQSSSLQGAQDEAAEDLATGDGAPASERVGGAPSPETELDEPETVVESSGESAVSIPEEGNGGTYWRGAVLDGEALDRCRQPLPGIAALSADVLTQYDGSAFDSSHAFDVAGSGEWDDNANYRRFLDSVTTAPVHETVDVSNRQFVVVMDEDGRGVPNCSLALTDEAGTRAELTTLASGRAAVFPALYGFAGPVSIKADCSSRSGHATLSLETADEVAVIELQGSRTAPETGTLDLAFVLDVTGSMSAEIEAMKETIDAVATEVVNTGQSRVRLALVAYRDYGDNPVFQSIDFTEDLGSFREAVGALGAAGGGDTPEAVNEAMHWATRLDWNPDATARMAFVIADAPPHPHEDNSAVQSAAVLACGGVKVFTVATTGQDPTGRFIFRQMSQLSSATHMFLLRVGAAADSACADYAFRTGELHNLVLDRVQQELAAPEQEPMDIPGLGADRDAEIAEALDECAETASVAAGAERAPSLR